MKVELNEDPETAKILHANRQRIADITFEFRDTFADGDTNTGNLFEGEQRET